MQLMIWNYSHELFAVGFYSGLVSTGMSETDALEITGNKYKLSKEDLRWAIEVLHDIDDYT